MNTDIYQVFPSAEGRYKFVVRGRLSGKYARKYFKTRTDAETWAEIKNTEALNQGIEHVDFSTSLRLQAQRAEHLLKPYNVSLLDAVKIALPIIKTRQHSVQLKKALDGFLEDYRLHGGPKTAVPSVSYLKFLADMLGPLKKKHGDDLVADVGIPEVEALLASRKKAGAVTRQSYLRAISAFFSWCVRKEYRMDNPLSKLRRKIPSGEVSILSIDDTEKVIDAGTDEEMAFLLLALFCGIRIAEFHKTVRDSRGTEREVWLDWKEVDLKSRQVFIPRDLDKNRHGRYVDIPLNATTSLQELRRISGPIMPSKWRERREALEERANVNLPQNVFRHSFCSYRIALDQDYAKAAAIVGNSPAMLRKHYVRVLPRKLGREYFKIKPKKSQDVSKIIQIKAA